MPTLLVNNAAVIKHTARLEKIHRSALPIAVRNTLSRAAFDVKQKTMPEEGNIFIKRKPTFLTANSKVVPAKGFDVNSMEALVGFLPKPNDSSHSVEDLQQQELGGSIANRAFIALPKARAGNSWKRMVRAKNRLGKIRKNIVDVKKANGKTEGERFIKSAIHAGEGGFVLNESHSGVFEINSVHRLKENVKTKEGKKYKKWDTVINSTLVDSVVAGRHAHVKATHFMQKASLRSAEKMEVWYREYAEKQVNKYR